MKDFQIFEILVGIVTLLSGYFGIPKITEALYIKRQENKILRALAKLQQQLKVDQGRGLAKTEVFVKLKNLLWEAKDVFKNKEFLQNQLEHIVSDLYKASQYDSIQDLRAKFENHFELSAVSWANIAIANMSMYRWDNMVEYRENCMEACKQSSRKLPNYGTPRAVQLIVFMIDYSRNKKIDNQSIQNMINEINLGDDTLVSRETYSYLMSCRELKGWTKYIDLLFSLFPIDMTTMEKRHSRNIG